MNGKKFKLLVIGHIRTVGGHDESAQVHASISLNTVLILLHFVVGMMTQVVGVTSFI